LHAAFFVNSSDEAGLSILEEDCVREEDLSSLDFLAASEEPFYHLGEGGRSVDQQLHVNLLLHLKETPLGDLILAHHAVTMKEGKCLVLVTILTLSWFPILSSNPSLSSLLLSRCRTLY